MHIIQIYSRNNNDACGKVHLQLDKRTANSICVFFLQITSLRHQCHLTGRTLALESSNVFNANSYFRETFAYVGAWHLYLTLLFVVVHVSELRLPQAYCSSPSLYEHGEPWEKDTDMGKPVPVPLCLPKIPHGLTRARTRTSAVKDCWLTTGVSEWQTFL
jgi:hypothetical protein